MSRLRALNLSQCLALCVRLARLYERYIFPAHFADCWCDPGEMLLVGCHRDGDVAVHGCSDMLFEERPVRVDVVVCGVS